MIWAGCAKSVLDLCILPADLSADMSVVDVRDGRHVHRALAVWVHPGTVGSVKPVEKLSII